MSDQRNRPRSPHQSDTIANTENAGSSRSAADDRTDEDGMIRSFRNLSVQGQDQDQGQVTNRTRPALPSITTVLTDYDRNLGRSPVVQTHAHQHGVIESQRNALGQGQGQHQGQANAPAQTVMMEYDRYLGIPGLQQGWHQHQGHGHGHGHGHGYAHGQGQGHGNYMVFDYDRYMGRPIIGMSHMPYYTTLLLPYNQMMVSSQRLGNLNIMPGPTSGFFMPRSIHEHNMRYWSDPNMVGVYTQEELMIHMGIPGTTFSHFLPFPNMNIGFPVVRPHVNPASLMPRTHIHGYYMGIILNPNMAVGYGDEDIRWIRETSDHSTEDTTSNDDGSDDTRDEHSEHDYGFCGKHGPMSGKCQNSQDVEHTCKTKSHFTKSRL